MKQKPNQSLRYKTAHEVRKTLTMDTIELNRTRKNLICVALHPGTVKTEFTQNYPQHKMLSPREAARNLLNVIDLLTPEDSGGFRDWAGKNVTW